MPSAIESNYIQVLNLFSIQFGVSRAQAKRLVDELCNVVLLMLKESKQHKVILPKLGEFLFCPENNTLSFKPIGAAVEFLGVNGDFQKISLSQVSDLSTYYIESLNSDLNKELNISPLENTLAGQLSILDILNESVEIPSKADHLKQIRRPNNPDPVRKAFMDYLKWQFAVSKDWVHPSGTIYTHADIKASLKKYKILNPLNYRALWTRWQSDQSREFIAAHFGFSSSTIRRRWDEAISSILAMLIFPELTPENIRSLYEEA